MATNDKKISKIVSKQFPEFVRSRHPELLTFIEKYYTLMESAVLTLSNRQEVDQIQLETAETSFLQLNATDEFKSNTGDYIIDEQSIYGDFISGEIITGATSGQTATILVEDSNNSKLYITANTKFVIGETITGATSGASATIGNYRGNPVENINQLLEYVDVDQTLDNFFLEFRNQLLNAIPNNLVAGLDKRKFTKNIIDLYQKKGTTEGHKTFFRALLDENAEIYYPTIDLLRVSDGNWKKRKLIKVTLKSPTDADTANLLNQTITQTEIVGNDFVNTATAIVNQVDKETINGVVVSTLYLEDDSIIGNFRFSNDDDVLLEDGDSILLETGDKIDQETEIFLTGVDKTDPEVLIQCVIRPSIDQVTITNRGAYYVPLDTISFSNEGSGIRATLQIDDVSSAGITKINVEDGGSGYAVNDPIAVTNTGTGGTDLAAVVSVVNGGFTLEGEDEFQLLDEDGGIVVMEDETNSNLGDITDIKITNQGGGYEKLPIVTVTSSGGSGADIFASNPEIGKLLKVNVLNHGYNYQAVPDVNLHSHLQIKNVSSSFTVGETVTSTTTNNIVAETFEQITHTFLTESSRSAEYRLEDDNGSIQLEDATYDYTGVEEKLLIDDIPREENVIRKNIKGTLYSDEILTEDGFRIVLDDVQEIPQVTNIVDETNGDNFLLEQQTTSTATVAKFNGDDQLLELVDIDNAFSLNETITGSSSGSTATIVSDDSGSATATIGTVVTDSGVYINVDGHVSENSKKIQDSDYYQDFSYVVKVGEAIQSWRDDLKRSMHPAGFKVFGEVSIASQVNAKMKTGFTLSSGVTETDEIVELFELIFSEKIGRRLGTIDDGTSLRSTPSLGIEGSASFGTTRDVTLKREYKVIMNSDRERQVQSVNVTRGFVYAGPRYSNINRFASTAFDTTASDSGITLDVLNNIKIRGTGKTPPNENTPTFADFTSDLRTNFTLPTEITTTTSP